MTYNIVASMGFLKNNVASMGFLKNNVASMGYIDILTIDWTKSFFQLR